MNRLVGRVCIVTGSTGIAAAAATRLAAEGAHTFVVSRTAGHAQELAARITALGGRPDENAGTWGTFAKAVEGAASAFGERAAVDALEEGEDLGLRDYSSDLDKLDLESRRTLELNLTTQALVCHSVVARMRDQEPNGSGTRGSILLMGSVTATDPAPEFFATHAYAAAKGALTSLMTTMAAAYLPDRIRVNVVAPGLTETPMARRAAADPAIRAYAARKQPLAGELMDPDEIAHAAVFFLSDESRTITGQLLKVDGGWSVASVSPEPDRANP